MNRTLAVAAVLASAACARETIPDRPLSAHEHIQEATRHEKEAVALERNYNPNATEIGPPIDCIDSSTAGVPTSGTERLSLVEPCWTRDRNPTAYQREIAARHRAEAAHHREAAAALVATEHEACAGLGEDELSHTPFFHTEDIVWVEPYRKDGELRGARVAFRKLPGLTEAWLRRAIHCHQTRAGVMGYTSTFMSYCPASLEGVVASVRTTSDAIVVTLSSPRDEIAAAVLGRGRDLLKERTR